MHLYAQQFHRKIDLLIGKFDVRRDDHEYLPYITLPLHTKDAEVTIVSRGSSKHDCTCCRNGVAAMQAASVSRADTYGGSLRTGRSAKL
jgi:hypothetical protein